MRTIFSLTAAALLALPTAAQDHADHQVNGDGLPAGWSGRVDRGSLANVNFRTMGAGWHVTVGPAVILWRPDQRAEGNYTISATMVQTTAPEHPEAYGLFIGGSDLTGENQSYLYFLVRKDGQFLAKSRTGSQTANLTDGWTQHSAVRAADANGRQNNQFSIRVADGTVSFIMNGEVVWSGQQPAVRTNGLWGMRVNHNLDVHVEGMTLESR